MDFLHVKRLQGRQRSIQKQTSLLGFVSLFHDLTYLAYEESGLTSHLDPYLPLITFLTQHGVVRRYLAMPASVETPYNLETGL